MGGRSASVDWFRKYGLKIAIAIGIAIAIDCGIGRWRRDSDSDPVWANELPILVFMRGDDEPIGMIVYCFFL